MCCTSIDITAKTGSGSAVISLRQNELIGNLRALVAVKFEQAIDIIVLVFGGQVLRDVGTIDSHGIISGATVHVIFRELTKMPTAKQNGSKKSARSKKSRNWIFKNVEIFKPLLDDTDMLRDLLLSDSRLKTLLDEDVSIRHFLSSDRNLRELFSTAFNPAKLQELGRMRDLNIMRLECLPGGYSVLAKVNRFIREAHEDNVAVNYQEAQVCDSARYHGNPQRGLENKSPLPNPWSQHQPKPDSQTILADMTLINNMMQSMTQGVLGKTAGPMHEINLMTGNVRLQLNMRIKIKKSRKKSASTRSSTAQPADTVASTAADTAGGTAASTAGGTAASTATSLNLIDFMSINNQRWEQQFHSQLHQLKELGHLNRQRNICALLMSSGDIPTALQLLQQWSR